MSTISQISPPAILIDFAFRNIKFESPIQLVANATTLHKTFMDTVGRTSLRLTAMNVVDESREKELIVTYDYPFIAAYRKPITVFLGIFAVFVAAWGISMLDVGIGKP